MYMMLVVDLMHEFELGVWKALFIHLLRMLNAVDAALVHELDRRYVPLSPVKYCPTELTFKGLKGTDKFLVLVMTPSGVSQIMFPN